MNAVSPAFPWATVGGPNGWQNLNARRLFKEVVVRSHGDEPLASATQERGIVARDDLDIQVWNPESDTSNYKRIEPGQFVISLRSFQGGFEISRITGILSPAYTTLHPLRPDLNEFYRWFFKSVPFISAVNSVASGIRQGKAIKFEDFASLSLPVPPSKDAGIISAYLDRETGRIDALVERLERLIALLTEKRQAVISEAVTKGLNPDAPMKDSGIDWLGEVPAHWEVKRLKHIVVPKGVQIGPFGQFLREHTVDASTTKLIGQENVLSNDFAKGDRWINDDQYEGVPRYWVVEGDILFTRKGSIGKCSVVPPMMGRAIIDSDTIRVRLDETIAATAFVRLALTQSTMSEVQTRLNARGAILSGVNSETLGNMVLCLPPLAEQVDLMTELNSQLQEFASAIGRVEKMITASKERRSALISAAVTGQIPVAEMIPDTQPEDAA
ncbi:restriction endonuclease subunit S [Yoonia litorea]|uniref:Type I restriction enzyme, S subunit n=1 Tax=Yoonia litorea TaxID=1123755 RepID=A0A1I6MWG3_9RHOB|nr:restriction endonuclease subunit S [Yoonia litorea]SFS20046.1 type I restriction enzyme, S subunit [Yoonia litorea]